MNQITLQVGQSVVLTGAGADANGNPADLDPNTQMTWAVDQPTIGGLSPQSQTPNCTFTATAVGACVVTATSKAAHGPGGVLPTVSGQLGVTDTAGPVVATQIIITAGTPTSPQIV